jgi:hypothetical protein
MPVGAVMDKGLLRKVQIKVAQAAFLASWPSTLLAWAWP